MKKLLKLLNEYGKPSCRGKKREKLDLECADRFYAISKYYGFIKWLVDNDKIDRGKIEERISGDVSLYLDNREYYGRYKWLLMLLSIQESPIEFLISILK